MEYDEEDVLTEEDEAMYSEEEAMYSEDEAMYTEDEASYESDCSDFAVKPSLQKTYRVLQEADVKQLLEKGAERIHSALSLSKDDAQKLFYHYKWNESLLLDEWFDDEERVRKKVGLLSGPTDFRFTDQLTTCGICFESFPLDYHHFYPTGCGHWYCIMCWKDYLSVSINDGPQCLSLRCPEPKCRAVVVDKDMIDKLATEEERRKCAIYLFRSYVEENKKAKWCPAPGCENAVELDIGSAVYDVTCLCSHAFCWNCVEEVHRPVDCKTVAKWVQKNSSESENTAWIIANSKPCPNCKKSIEKNQGCMHMTCKCSFEFCWLCLGPWSKHGSQTGGNYNCNIYQEGEAEAGLERLHQCAEQELDSLMANIEVKYPKEADQQQLKANQETPEANPKTLEAGYREFRLKLTDLTIVTRSYFENLVRALENDLSEVKPVVAEKWKEPLFFVWLKGHKPKRDIYR